MTAQLSCLSDFPSPVGTHDLLAGEIHLYSLLVVLREQLHAYEAIPTGQRHMGVQLQRERQKNISYATYVGFALNSDIRNGKNGEYTGT